MASQAEILAELLPLARSLTEHRLLVVRAGLLSEEKPRSDTEGDLRAAENRQGKPGATIEVAHEALLRRWKLLTEILGEDRDALLLLDSVRLAAAEWTEAEDTRKSDFLAHRGARLAEAQALRLRGPNWAQEIAPAQPYLTACQERQANEKRSKRLSRGISQSSWRSLLEEFSAALNYDRLRVAAYRVSSVRGYVKSPDQDRLLLEKGMTFRECRDCPDMIFVHKGVFERGGPLRDSPDRNREFSDFNSRNSAQLRGLGD